jgi:monoamine oxidase
MDRKTGLITRRAMLAGGAAVAGGLAAPQRMHGRESRMSECDVVVVGAGAAGLAAAEVLIAAGRRVQIIEARDRVGGRAFTDQAAGVPFDAGAAYVHYYERNPWVAMAKDLGVSLEPHRGFGRGVPYRGGLPLDDQERRARIAARRRLSDLLDAVTPETPDRSMAELVAGENEAVAEAVQRYGSQAIGEDPQRISIVDLALLWEGDDLVAPDGYGSLVTRAATGLPVALNTPATRIDWSGAGVVVETPGGAIRAQHVIVTVPVGVLAAEAITFDPPLPAATRDAIGDLPMGALSKVALAFDGNRLGQPTPSDAYDLDAGMNFEFWPFDRNIVVVTIGGDAARALTGLGEAGAVAATLDRLVAIVGGDVRRHVTGGRMAGWWHDPHARGSYAVARPGRRAARAALATPVGDRIMFAGEATGGEGEASGAVMTVGGATLAGRAAAAKVLRLTGGMVTAP